MDKISQQVISNLKKDGISLQESDLQSVVHLLTRLAKIEYEQYRQKKTEKTHGQSPESPEIGHHTKKSA